MVENVTYRNNHHLCGSLSPTFDVRHHTIRVNKKDCWDSRKPHCREIPLCDIQINIHVVGTMYRFLNICALDFDLSMSLKVKFEWYHWTPDIYDFLLMFNSNIWLNMAPLRDTNPINSSDLECDLSRSLKHNGAIRLPIYYILLMPYSNHMSISHRDRLAAFCSFILLLAKS